MLTNSDWTTLSLAVTWLLLTTCTSHSDQCNEKLEACGQVGDVVQFTICLTRRGVENQFIFFKWDHWWLWGFRYINETNSKWNLTWKNDERLGAQVDVRILEESVYDFNLTIGLFTMSPNQTQEYFRLKIKNGTESIQTTQRPFIDDRDSSTSDVTCTEMIRTTELPLEDVDDTFIPIIIAEVAALVAIAVVGLIVYKRRDKTRSLNNQGTTSKDKNEEKLPQPQQNNEEEETVLSNPVYGMSNKLGEQESNNDQVYLNIK